MHLARPWGLDGWTVRASPQLLVPDYFSHVGGRDVDFERDYLVPFIRRYADAVRAADPEALIFAEGEPQSLPPQVSEGYFGFVSAPHWYDALPLLLKRPSAWLGYDVVRNRIVLGARAVRRSSAWQLAAIRRAGTERLHGPTVIGEIGVPYDLRGGRSFRTGDYREQEALMDRSLCAVESSLCSATIWNYTASNTNERGDGWNGEDLSIWSADQGRDTRVLDRGGRALRAVVRPYPVATAGEPLQSLLRYAQQGPAFYLPSRSGCHRAHGDLRAAVAVPVRVQGMDDGRDLPQGRRRSYAQVPSHARTADAHDHHPSETGPHQAPGLTYGSPVFRWRPD